MKSLKPYQGAEHEAFHWVAGEKAALLIHGFPGTPAEMRAVGEVLYGHGWTVRCPLLPGFGAQIETLARRTSREWLDTVCDLLTEIHQHHPRVALIGYSMGGALAVQAAVQHQFKPDAIILLAPFTQLVTGATQLVWPVVRLLMKEFRPFEKADFSDPKVRKGIHHFMPEADLSDAATQQFIRSISLPMKTIEQLRQTGHNAIRCAPLLASLDLPLLVVQGTDDEVVKAETTRQFVQRMSGDVRYCEVSSGHDLIRPDDAAFPQVLSLMTDFLHG